MSYGYTSRTCRAACARVGVSVSECRVFPMPARCKHTLARIHTHTHKAFLTFQSKDFNLAICDEKGYFVVPCQMHMPAASEPGENCFKGQRTRALVDFGQANAGPAVMSLARDHVNSPWA